MKRFPLLLLGLGLLPPAARGQARSWEAAVAGGAALNLPTPLRIAQRGAPLISLTARYRTEPFEPPVYYDLRVATWRGERGWAVKMTHHKLILRNRPAEVQRFSLTDGFNLVTASRLWQRGHWRAALGAGVVVTHPESTVRGQAFAESGGLLGSGYFLSGPTVEAALARHQPLGRRWFVQGEGRLTASYVRVPIRHGHARVSNAALHGLLGLGYQLHRSEARP